MHVGVQRIWVYHARVYKGNVRRERNGSMGAREEYTMETIQVASEVL